MIRYAPLALLALAACSRAGGSSPEDVFNKAKEASEKKDWKTLYACVDPQEADSMLMAMMMVAGFATMGNADGKKEIEAIALKHGVKKADESVSMSDRAAQKKAAADAFSGVKDKPAFFAELMTAVEKYAKDGVSITKGTLKDVKTDGDKATATVDRGDGKTDTMTFVRRDGRWYLGME